ncbi:MAG: tRNA (adenosine(37)-N6)-threonylcarbamoyltransferase complex dimerization subunit type 1 TsaB [Bacteroidia bacterium]|nr:MAG: tRNA (adenosine(37)-N6)-threonylcarbamoyltransferase complex dimerization subunit type 1 TsaB [Bacteroidia bacterium]
MTKALILHIETATDICSVALSEGDQQLSLVESGQERSHAILLNQFVRRAVADSGYTLKELDAVAVSKGPGSYTGLRIGVSTAKGLAYALEIPLLATGTLENMAHGALTHPEVIGLADSIGEQLLLCPMLDARRMEVYAGFYTLNNTLFRAVSADIIDEDTYKEILASHQVCFFGNGSGKCKELLTHPNAHFIDGVDPSSSSMIEPVLKRYMQQQFEDVAYFEPFYLKDFIATTSKKKVL